MNIFILLLGKVMQFLPIETVANYHDVKVSSLKSLFYKNYAGKDLKFKIKDGKLLVNLDYKYPLAQKLDELRQKALIIAKNEHNLAKELSLLLGKKEDSILRYFIRYTFKRTKLALDIINALEIYIAKNSLFGTELTI